MSSYEQSIVPLIRIASAAAVVTLGLCVSPGLAAAISGRGDAEFAVAALWSMIGPLLAVSDRLPGLGAACDPLGPAMSPL